MVMTRDKVVELMLKMIEGNASIDEMEKVTEFSREVIHAEKHISQHYTAYNIGELVEKYGREK